ncbi:MAG TPA: hypothetical protein PKN75_00485 [Bacteroidia bacterium]|nr:hypothetical protein [Bacteroidia bacterium]HNU32048.1 hypothetical protein [Bacteroidia bacterium]
MLILLFSVKVTFGLSDDEKIQQRKLIVVADSGCSKIYGVKDYTSFFKYAFSKVWKTHSSIIYTTCDSLKQVLSVNPDDFVVIKIERVSYYRPSSAGSSVHDFGYNTALVLGAGKEFLKDPPMVKKLYYEIDFLSKIYSEELVFAIKRINDEIQCNLNKVNCSLKEQMAGSKEVLLKKTLLIPGYLLSEANTAENIASLFPCKVEVAPNEEVFWNTLTGAEDKYNLLCLSSQKKNGRQITYYLIEMTNYRVLEYDTPGGYEFVRHEYSRISYNRLKTIGKVISKANWFFENHNLLTFHSRYHYSFIYPKVVSVRA